MQLTYVVQYVEKSVSLPDVFVVIPASNLRLIPETHIGWQPDHTQLTYTTCSCMFYKKICA